MKDILESEETFEAYALIDSCYYLLKKEYEKMTNPTSPLDRMIDKATGYGEAKVSETKETIIDLLNTVIKAKKIIEADYSNDVKALNEIKEIA